jgi:hypothetical protein
MPPTKSICIPHRHPDYDDDGEYEYEEVTVLTFEETEEDGTDEAAGIASGEEYFYYEEVTIADEDTVVTKHDAGTVADPRYGSIVEDDHLDGPSPPQSRAAPDHHHHHHGSIGDNDEFSRMDESVLFRRAMEERDARGLLPTTTTAAMAAAPTKLGRMASSSSSVAFSYANVGRRYDFVQILDDDDDDVDLDDHPNGSRRQPQCWNEWQTLASQTLFVEEDDDDDDDDQEEEDDEEASPVPSPAPAAGAAPVRDIYWEPPIKSVGWRWCGVGGGGGETATASASPTKSRGRRRYFGFVLFVPSSQGSSSDRQRTSVPAHFREQSHELKSTCI